MIGHREWRLSLIVACLTLPGVVHAAPPSNLLPNSSFDREADGKPVSWEYHRWSGDADVEVVAQGHTRKGSVMVCSEKGTDFSLSTNVPVEPFATYRLSGWIKTENVRSLGGRGALLNIHDIFEAASTAVTGTHDWTRVEVVFNTFGHRRLGVHCGLGRWGHAAGKAWFDDISLRLVRRYTLDYSYLFHKAAAKAPTIAYYGGRTAIAERPFHGSTPRLRAGDEDVRWRLTAGPDGMSVDAATGAPSWPKPTLGHHRVLIEAKNSSGRDILEFIVIVVQNDIPGGEVIATKHMDFVLPPEGVRWFEKWKPQANIDAQFEYLRKLIGHEPAPDGKQVVKYQPDMGGGAHSGNPAPVGPGFWRWDDVGGWQLGIWWHEVGHNFNAQAPMVFYSHAPGFDYHHHCFFLYGVLSMKTVAHPSEFGLSGLAADNYRHWTELPGGPGGLPYFQAYLEWLKKGGTAQTFKGNGFWIWGHVCNQLSTKYGVEIMEKTVRAMRTDGVPTALRETAKTPLQVNALLYCIMSHAAGTDLRGFFEKMGYEYDAQYYASIDNQIAAVIKNLPDEDDLDGWKKNPHNGHYYRRTMLDSNWHAAEVEARQVGGHLATIRNSQELKWLQSRFEIYPLVWIGGYENTKRQHEWKWISGERSQFTNWDNGQPAAAQDPCFTILATGSGKWQAKTSPAQSLPGIIEVNAKPLATQHDP